MRKVSRGYSAFRVCVVLAILTGHSGTANVCACVADSMDYADNLWNLISAGTELGTDGLVQASSQYYPPRGLVRNYEVRYGDSHAGEPRSNLSRIVLENSLVRDFGVVRR